MMTFGISVIVAFGTCVLFVPLVRRLAWRYQMLDLPAARKVHRRAVPRLGGVAVYLAWAAALFAAIYGAGRGLMPPTIGTALMLSGAVVLFGAWDDWRDLPGKEKLFWQVAIASAAFLAGIEVDRISHPLGGQILFPGPVSYVVTVLWIIGMMNAINLIDGLDGLACGVCAISAFGLAFMNLGGPLRDSAIMLAALGGACAGFLRYNFYPAQIFLGDSGSQFLGFVLAITALVDRENKVVTALTLLMPLAALALPILDTGLAFIRRLRVRTSVFRADKGHLHHRLLRMGLTQRQIVSFFYLLTIYLNCLAFVFAPLSDRYAFVLLVLLALGFLMAMETLRFLEWRIKTTVRPAARLRRSG